MSRKHLFPIVVMLAAAFLAGLLAVSRTVAWGRPASAATASDPAIAFRLKKLDRFEQSLRRQLARTAKAQQSTVYRRAPSANLASSHGDDDHQEDDRDD
jgi:ABC-type sugar transport system substrate-binding protein